MFSFRGDLPLNEAKELKANCTVDRKDDNDDMSREKIT